MIDNDLPELYAQMPAEKQAALLAWIRATLHPGGTKNTRTSYGMKNDFEISPGGFHISNGEFKGAMLACGFEPLNRNDRIWEFLVGTYTGQGKGV